MSRATFYWVSLYILRTPIFISLLVQGAPERKENIESSNLVRPGSERLTSLLINVDVFCLLHSGEKQTMLVTTRTVAL